MIQLSSMRLQGVEQMDDPCLPANGHMNLKGFFQFQDVSTCVNMLLISLHYLVYPWKKSGFNGDLLRDNIERQYSSLFFLCQMCTNTCTYIRIYPKSVSQYTHMLSDFYLRFYTDTHSRIPYDTLAYVLLHFVQRQWSELFLFALETFVWFLECDLGIKALRRWRFFLNSY